MFLYFYANTEKKKTKCKKAIYFLTKPTFCGNIKLQISGKGPPS